MSGQMVCSGGSALVAVGGEGRSEYATTDPVAQHIRPQCCCGAHRRTVRRYLAAEVARAVYDGSYHNGKWGQREIDIRCIWDIGRGNKLNSEPDTLLGIKAFRKVEFVVSCDCFQT
ncbi:MAG: hypothetical protein ACLTSX_13300 [Collinsella sp.]